MKQHYLDCISVENMRESDRLTIENYVSGRTLMYRAAMGVYKAVGWRGNIVIATGGGNNGGDGYALACILTENDFSCRIVKLSDKLTDDSGYFAEWAKALGVPTQAYSDGAFAGADMIVDCLLGTGFQGSLREPFLGAVNEINESGAEVSGLFLVMVVRKGLHSRNTKRGILFGYLFFIYCGKSARPAD